MTGSSRGRRRRASGDESTLTVLVALAVNLAIALAKVAAAAVTGSVAMSAEAAHSVADTANELFLLTALRRSARPADGEHPLGYGQERYFWSFVAAISIFVSGALFAGWQGLSALLSGEHDLTDPLVSLVVLGVAFVLEATSWVRGMTQVRHEAAAHEQSVLAFLRRNDDPTVTTVVLEDSAALVGLVLAGVGIGLHELTGSASWDALASLAIAALLAWVAYRLARASRRLLVGAQADSRLVRAIAQWLRDQPAVEALADLLTLQTGTARVLVCARVDFVDDLDAAGLERAALAMDEGLRDRFPEIIEVFLEPVPRHDAGVRQRVRDRYGDVIADRLERSGE